MSAPGPNPVNHIAVGLLVEFRPGILLWPVRRDRLAAATMHA